MEHKRATFLKLMDTNGLMVGDTIAVAGRIEAMQNVARRTKQGIPGYPFLKVTQIFPRRKDVMVVEV